MEFENIKLDIADQIATITLNKPERLNACSLDMADEIFMALDLLEDARAVISPVRAGPFAPAQTCKPSLTVRLPEVTVPSRR